MSVIEKIVNSVAPNMSYLKSLKWRKTVNTFFTNTGLASLSIILARSIEEGRPERFIPLGIASVVFMALAAQDTYIEYRERKESDEIVKELITKLEITSMFENFISLNDTVGGESDNINDLSDDFIV